MKFVVAASILAAGNCIAAAILWEGRLRVIPYGQYVLIYDRWDNTVQNCAYDRGGTSQGLTVTRQYCGDPSVR
jgi:hypothetical protein